MLPIHEKRPRSQGRFLRFAVLFTQVVDDHMKDPNATMSPEEEDLGKRYFGSLPQACGSSMGLWGLGSIYPIILFDAFLKVAQAANILKFAREFWTWVVKRGLGRRGIQFALKLADWCHAGNAESLHEHCQWCFLGAGQNSFEFGIWAFQSCLCAGCICLPVSISFDGMTWYDT